MLQGLCRSRSLGGGQQQTNEASSLKKGQRLVFLFAEECPDIKKQVVGYWSARVRFALAPLNHVRYSPRNDVVTGHLVEAVFQSCSQELPLMAFEVLYVQHHELGWRKNVELP